MSKSFSSSLMRQESTSLPSPLCSRASRCPQCPAARIEFTTTFIRNIAKNFEKSSFIQNIVRKREHKVPFRLNPSLQLGPFCTSQPIHAIEGFFLGLHEERQLYFRWRTSPCLK